MDTKEHWLIKEILADLRACSFCERDVLSLLILLREHADGSSPVREFGDFIAHRDRDRGVLFEFLKRVQQRLLGQESAQEEPPHLPVFTIAEIASSLNSILSDHGFEILDAELTNQVIVCIITLLQGIKIQTKVDSPTSVRGFAVGVSSNELGLLGYGIDAEGNSFYFPMLIAQNNGYDYSLAQPDSPVIPMLIPIENIVVASCVDGVFGIEQQIVNI